MGKERPPRVAPGALATVAPALPFALRLLCPASFRHRQNSISPVGMCGFVSLIAQILVLNPYISISRLRTTGLCTNTVAN